MYDWLKLIHILAIVVWVGGAAFIIIHNPRLMAIGDRAVTGSLIRTAELAGRIFMISAIIALGTGILMVLDDTAAWEFSQTWISIGFIGIAVGAVLGPAFYGPSLRKMRAALESDDQPTLTALGQRLGIVSMAELAVLVVVIWSMVFKPGL